MKTDRAAVKTALLAPVGTVQAWGIQQILGDDPLAGAVAVVLSIGMVATYVIIQEYDIPYEDAIRELASSSDTDQTADTVADVSEQVADEIENMEGN